MVLTHEDNGLKWSAVKCVEKSAAAPPHTCDRGHSFARALWLLSLSSSFRAFLTVAWVHCSDGRSSRRAKLQRDHMSVCLSRCLLVQQESLDWPLEEDPQRHHVVNVQQHVGHRGLWSVCQVVDGHRVPPSYLDDACRANQKSSSNFSKIQTSAHLWVDPFLPSAGGQVRSCGVDLWQLHGDLWSLIVFVNDWCWIKFDRRNPWTNGRCSKQVSDEELPNQHLPECSKRKLLQRSRSLWLPQHPQYVQTVRGHLDLTTFLEVWCVFLLTSVQIFSIRNTWGILVIYCSSSNNPRPASGLKLANVNVQTCFWCAEENCSSCERSGLSFQSTNIYRFNQIIQQS